MLSVCVSLRQLEQKIKRPSVSKFVLSCLALPYSTLPDKMLKGLPRQDLMLLLTCSTVCVYVVKVKQKINQAYESLHVVFRRSSASEEGEQEGADSSTLSSDRDSSELITS